MPTHPLHLGVALDGAGWHPAAWRHDTARPTELFTTRYWLDLVLRAEAAGIDLVTIEDSFGLQSGAAGYGPLDAATANEPGEVRGRLDALLLASALAPHVTSIGLVPTVTTTHTEPFHVGTATASLDHASDGWGGWRVQVSGRAHEAAHVGRRELPVVDPAVIQAGTDAHALALLRELFGEALDTIEVARRLWDSWEDDAVIRDAGTGRFLDRDKLHYIDFEGANFTVKGPSITPRPPQGQPPVYVLAHQTVPYELAVAGADIVGITPHTDEHLAAIRSELDDVALRTVRRVAEPLRVWTELVVLLEDSAEAAAAELARLDELHGTPFTTDTIVFAGTPAGLAERLESWHAAGIDGVRIRPARLPLDLERIADGLVPALDPALLERPTDARTLRERLGFAPATNRYTAAGAAAPSAVLTPTESAAR